ncbi:MAG TPA: Ig domain-containing protein, partial [Gemmataceae bacterium]|nr:Ig domain-containing protein [Gemmataceae bacterium]
MRGSSPPRQAAVGQLYTYPVRASDPDGDPLRYEVVSGPAGLTIDPLGRVSWPTAGVTPGSYAVQLRVSDSYGAAAPLHSYSITVRADTQPPAVQLTIAPYPTVPIGGTVYFQVTATDNVGVSRQTLEVRFEGETEPFWQPVALNGSGLGQVTARGLGLVRVRARAYDTANNQGEALD